MNSKCIIFDTIWDIIIGVIHQSDEYARCMPLGGWNLASASFSTNGDAIKLQWVTAELNARPWVQFRLWSFNICSNPGSSRWWITAIRRKLTPEIQPCMRNRSGGHSHMTSALWGNPGVLHDNLFPGTGPDGMSVMTEIEIKSRISKLYYNTLESARNKHAKKEFPPRAKQSHPQEQIFFPFCSNIMPIMVIHHRGELVPSPDYSR